MKWIVESRDSRAGEACFADRSAASLVGHVVDLTKIDARAVLPLTESRRTALARELLDYATAGSYSALPWDC